MADLTYSRRIITNRIDNLRLAGDPLNGTDYDRAGSNGGISDPVPNQAHHLSRYHELLADIEGELVTVVSASARLTQLLQRAPSDVDTAATARQHRCSGGEPGTEGWERPECEAIADTRDGLCFACYQRRHHHRSKAKMTE